MTATEDIVQILVLLTFVVRVWCSVGVSRNDINFKVRHMLKHRFEKILEQKQVTSTHTCGGDGDPQWYRGRCLPQLTQQAPRCQRAAQPIAHATMWWLFLSFCQSLPQRSQHVHFCHHLIPMKGEHILRNQFLRGLTDHCFCLSGITPSHSHQSTPFHLLVSCQPLPSRSHARSCFTRIL